MKLTPLGKEFNKYTLQLKNNVIRLYKDESSQYDLVYIMLCNCCFLKYLFVMILKKLPSTENEQLNVINIYIIF